MGQRFAICFLGSDGRLSQEQKDYVLRRAGYLYFNGESEGDIALLDDGDDSNSLEGRITGGQWVSLGVLSGVSYKAEVETPKGKARLSFLMRELTLGSRSTQYESEYTN